MIRDLFFVIKMLGITVLIVIFAQVKIGSKSVEDHFQEWIKTSMFVDSVQEVVDGGIALTKDGYQKAHLGIHGMLAKIHSHHDKKDRSLHFSLKRYNSGDGEDQAYLPQGKAPSAKAKGL